MPQIIFKGVKRQDAVKLSMDLAEKLAKASDTPKDYFTFEWINREYFSKGEVFEMYPLIEVVLFDRGKEIEKNMAKIIAQEVKSLGYKEVEVYFVHIEKENYYEF